MGHAYTILGRQVQPHVLAILTLGSISGLAAYASIGGKKEQTPSPAPASTGASDDINVEQLINNFIQQESQDDK